MYIHIYTVYSYICVCVCVALCMYPYVCMYVCGLMYVLQMEAPLEVAEKAQLIQTDTSCRRAPEILCC